MTNFPVGQGKERQKKDRQMKTAMTYIHLVMSETRVREDDQCSPIQHGPTFRRELHILGLIS